MKKYILLTAILAIGVTLFAQTWKTEVQSVTGKPKVKTMKIKPDRHINISHLVLDNDSMKETRNYNGYFLGANRDSIQFRLKEVKTDRVLTSGIRQQVTMKPKYFFKTPYADSSMKVAWADVDYFWNQNEKMINMAEIGEPIILGSLLVMLLSPLISYDFKDGKLNTERYKNWALGSTIGLASGILIPVTLGLVYRKHKFQFKAGWPEKKAKVWEFR